MGACLSLASVVATGTAIYVPERRTRKTPEDESDECFICSHAATVKIPLSCGHAIHAYCLIDWWRTQPEHTLQCPMCRQQSTGCIVVCNHGCKSPMYYFRLDNTDEDTPLYTMVSDTAYAHERLLSEDRQHRCYQFSIVSDIASRDHMMTVFMFNSLMDRLAEIRARGDTEAGPVAG